MIHIDGAAGEGGGQVLRNALALSLVTGESFRITDIRGGREKPGLMRQHLTAVEAALAISEGAHCEGAAVGATVLTFRPGRTRPGDYRFSIGTAGSTGLVLQTVLMPLLLADAPSTLRLEGGTHSMAAPPFDFIARSFLPLVERMGPRVAARLIRPGFYPRGGGAVEVDIEPAPLSPLELTVRGPLKAVSARALIAGLPRSIASRELATARMFLGWPAEDFVIGELPPEWGPGNVLMLEAVFEQVTEIMTGFGRFRTPAENLAGEAAKRMMGYLDSGVFAGPFLADQLLLPLALAGGGAFSTVKPSAHVHTAIEVIPLFTGRRWSYRQQAGGGWLISMA